MCYDAKTSVLAVTNSVSGDAVTNSVSGDAVTNSVSGDAVTIGIDLLGKGESKRKQHSL